MSHHHPHTPEPHHDAPSGPVLPGQPVEDPIPPEMSPEDTLGNLATLDRWRAAVGLRYPADER